MNVGGRRHAATTAARSPTRTFGGTQTVLAAGHWSFPAVAQSQSFFSPTVATSSGQLPTLPVVGPNLMMHEPESAFASPTLSFRVSETPADERRTTALNEPPLYSQRQRHHYVQQHLQHKRRRTLCSTDCPPSDLTGSAVIRSTSHDFSTNAFELSSIPHCYYRYRSFPYTMLPSSILLPPTSSSVELVPTRAAGWDLMRPPDYSSPEQRAGAHLLTQPADVLRDVEDEQLQRRQRLSVYGTNNPSSLTDGTDHRSLQRPIRDGSGGGGGGVGCQLGCQLTEVASVSNDHRRRSQLRSPTRPPRAVRRSLTPRLGAAPSDTRLSSRTSSRTMSASEGRGRFTRGSVIQLGDGQWKRMEELSEADFFHGAALKPGTQIELIAVAHILQNHDRHTVIIGFQLSSYQIQIAVEAKTEHPFFVCGKGWCSSSPQRSMSRYGLPCKQLVVGDCCMALSQAIQPPVSSVAVPADGRSSSDGPIDYSAVGASTTEFASPGTDPSRPGVIRTMTAATRRKRYRSSSESTTANIASSTAA